MNPGLPQGFVKLDSLACKILRAYHQYGPMIHTDLVDLLGDDERHISAVVGRLQKARMIWKQDRACKYDTGLDKTQWIFGLTPNPGRHYEVRKRTTAERQARYRDKLLRRRSNSIFNLGATQLQISLRAGREMETEDSR